MLPKGLLLISWTFSMCNCKLMLFLKVLWHNLHVVGPIFSSDGWGVVLVKMAAVGIENEIEIS